MIKEKSFCVCDGTIATGHHTEKCLLHQIDELRRRVDYWINQAAKQAKINAFDEAA